VSRTQLTTYKPQATQTSTRTPRNRAAKRADGVARTALHATQQPHLSPTTVRFLHARHELQTGVSVPCEALRLRRALADHWHTALGTHTCQILRSWSVVWEGWEKVHHNQRSTCTGCATAVAMRCSQAAGRAAGWLWPQARAAPPPLAHAGDDAGGGVGEANPSLSRRRDAVVVGRREHQPAAWRAAQKKTESALSWPFSLTNISKYW